MSLDSLFENITVPIFPCFIILVVVFMILRHKIKNSGKEDQKQEMEFWERENAANSVRAADISNLDYIKIPLDELPLMVSITDDNPSGDETLSECDRIITALSEKRILNLSGMTNTDIKMQYGPANLEALSSYDENFILLIRTLNTMGVRLYELKLDLEAMAALRYAVSIGTDIKETYATLAKLYNESESYRLISELKETAAGLNSISKTAIIKAIDEAVA